MSSEIYRYIASYSVTEVGGSKFKSSICGIPTEKKTTMLTGSKLLQVSSFLVNSLKARSHDPILRIRFLVSKIGAGIQTVRFQGSVFVVRISEGHL